MLKNGPKEKPQPELGQYPTTELELFMRFNRDTFQKEFGVQAPEWDKTKIIKRWFDTTALDLGLPADEVVIYFYFDFKQMRERKIVTTAGEAAAVNLPGVVVYPKYVISPTTAFISGPGGLTPLNPDILTLFRDAQALCEEVKGEMVVEASGFTGGPYIYNWNVEPRRQHLIRKGGVDFAVSSMLKQKYANGVGSPGYWKLDEVSGPIWISTVVTNSQEIDLRPEATVPGRKLKSNEKVVSTLFTGAFIVRTDKESELNPGLDTINPELRLVVKVLSEKLDKIQDAIDRVNS